MSETTLRRHRDSPARAGAGLAGVGNTSVVLGGGTPTKTTFGAARVATVPVIALRIVLDWASPSEMSIRQVQRVTP